MILYRIRHKKSGLFLSRCDYLSGNHYFSEEGTFWKLDKTIRKHLKEITYDVDFSMGDIEGTNRCWFTKKILSENPERLDDYEVVATHVIVTKENCMDSHKFLNLMNGKEKNVFLQDTDN